MQEKCSLLQQINAAQTSTIQQLESQHIMTMQRLSDAKAALQNANDQIRLLAQEKWELGQGKALLQGQLKQLSGQIHE